MYSRTNWQWLSEIVYTWIYGTRTRTSTRTSTRAHTRAHTRISTRARNLSNKLALTYY